MSKPRYCRGLRVCFGFFLDLGKAFLQDLKAPLDRRVVGPAQHLVELERRLLAPPLFETRSIRNVSQPGLPSKRTSSAEKVVSAIRPEPVHCEALPSSICYTQKARSKIGQIIGAAYFIRPRLGRG